MGVATDGVLKLLQEGDVTRISRPETLFILQKDARQVLRLSKSYWTVLLRMGDVRDGSSHQD